MARHRLSHPAELDVQGVWLHVAEDYLVFYLHEGEDVTVVRVLHGARDIGESFFD